MLEVSRSGFYAWKKREAQGPSPKATQRQQLIAKIKAVHQNTNGIYGSPKVYQELKKQGESVCENTVAKLMSQNQIRSIVCRRFRVSTTDSCHEYPVADNLLNRSFDQEHLNQAWVADITYVPTAQGWLYVAAVMDLCSRRIIGWAMADHLRAELCTQAMEMALTQRRPRAGLIHHSDRGVQYACGDYRKMLEEHGIVCSMSRKGDCYDNAVMESFFKTLKSELVYHQEYQTRQEAMRSIFQYIEVFYNRKRSHSSLGYKSPVEFEATLN
jgi:transposase InsO family protein